MKIRQGFVSNSSSSSYILLVKKAEAERVLSDYFTTPNQQAAVKHVLGSLEDVMGLPCYVISEFTTMGGYDEFTDCDFRLVEDATEEDRQLLIDSDWGYDYEDEEDKEVDGEDFVRAVCEKLKNKCNSANVWSHCTMDC